MCEPGPVRTPAGKSSERGVRMGGGRKLVWGRGGSLGALFARTAPGSFHKLPPPIPPNPALLSETSPPFPAPLPMRFLPPCTSARTLSPPHHPPLPHTSVRTSGPSRFSQPHIRGDDVSFYCPPPPTSFRKCYRPLLLPPQLSPPPLIPWDEDSFYRPPPLSVIFPAPHFPASVSVRFSSLSRSS